MTAEADEPLLLAAIADRLASAQPDPAITASARIRLFERVRQSVVAHREFLTVRREDGAWREEAVGHLARTLRGDATCRVEVVRLDPGTVFGWPKDVIAQEILVLGGALAGAPGDGGTTPQQATGYAYHVRYRSTAAAPLHAQGETTVYVRNLLVEVAFLPALEAHWWRIPGPSSGWTHPGRRRWLAASPGVEVLPLKGDSEVVSMLVRFAPGASVADHHHALDEDCLVLEGEMFLGDILLRAGDYQLAPAGGGHFGETSDVGVVFFFHGALDPVLRVKS